MNESGCELRIRGAWVAISLEDLLDRNIASDREKRCPECHGAVRVHRLAKNGMRAHFEHIEAHAGCSLGSVFSGVKSPHGRALR